MIGSNNPTVRLENNPHKDLESATVRNLSNDNVNASLPRPLVFTVEESAAALHVSTKTIRRLLYRGVLTSSRALRKKLIPRQQIEEFLKATCDVPKRLI